MKTEFISRVGFEAARQLPSLNLQRHGHSFVVTAFSNVPLNILKPALEAICEPWQMRDLNDFFQEPDDLTLARFVATSLQKKLSANVTIELRSAPNVGVRYEGVTEAASHWLLAEFSAAHFLPNVPEGHQCGRLHGHGFKVKLWLDAYSSTAAALATAWHPLFTQLQHSHLNHIAGLENPTSENLTEWLWQKLSETSLPLRGVEVFETSTAGSRRDLTGFKIWKELHFEAARPFDVAGHYTGHSYLVRLFLHGSSIDVQAGWLRDFSDVKAIFKPIYNQLDHYALDDIEDLVAYDCAALSNWMAGKLHDALPELSRVEVFENERDGVAVIVREII